MNHGMHDDARYERLFADALVELAPSRAPERLKSDIKQATSRSRPRPRWLAVVKEPPMRLASSLAVGSPTARLAAIMAATILIAGAILGAGVAGSRLFAAGDAIVVDASGGGDYTTITEAVAVAVDGDTILVRPGTYTEAVTIEADITVKGDGAVEEIIVTAPDDGPTTSIRVQEPGGEEDPYAILLVLSDATLSGLTFEGEPSEVIARGGSPTLEDLRFIGTGFPYDGSTTSAEGSSIVVNGGSTATVRNNTIIGGGPIGVFDASAPHIDGNVLSGGPHIWGGFGDGAVISGNTIENALVRAIGIFDPGSPLFERNTITGPGQIGFDIWAGTPLLEDNIISGSPVTGIAVSDAAPTLSGGHLHGNGTAISWSGAPGSEGLIEANVIGDGGAGIVVTAGAPMVIGNSVEGATGRAFVVGTGASPTLSGNTACTNAVNLFVMDGATPEIDDSNEFCEDAPPE